MRFPGMRKIPPLYDTRDEQRSRMGLRLDANENRWGPAPGVVAALRRLQPRTIASYPDCAALRKAAAGRFGVRPDRLLLTNGADEAIYALVSLLVGPGDRIVMPLPGFPLYSLAAGLRGARLSGVSLGPGFEFRLTEMTEKITSSTRLVVLTAPNNPTGTAVSSGEAEAVVRRAERFGVPVILDETYAGFGGRSFGRMTRRHANLIVLGSFSKFFALAGLRLGYVIAGPEVIAALRAVIPPFSVNAAAVEAGRAALASRSYYEGVAGRIAAARRRLAGDLRSSGLTVFPSAANFLCVRVGPDAERVRRRLAEKRIFVKSFPENPALSDCLRITVGTPPENKRLVKALKSVRSPEALLFDLDGVLVDVSGSYRRAIEETVFLFSGKRPSPAAVDRCKLRADMNNDWDASAAFLAEAGLSIPRRKIIAAFQDFYHGPNGRAGFRGAERRLLPLALLGRVARTHRLGIVTGRPRDEADRVLRRFRMDGLFGAVVAREDTGRKPKPHPRGIRLALERLSVRRAVFFGDSPSDMAAARAAGLQAVAVRPPGIGIRSGWVRRMKEAGADRFVDDLAAELERYL